MNTFKKTVIAIATLSTLAVAAAAPAQAGNNWQKPFVKGLGMGVGAGIGFGITNSLLNPQPQTVVVAPQPTYQPVYQTSCRQVAVYNGYGQYVGHQTVC